MPTRSAKGSEPLEDTPREPKEAGAGRRLTYVDWPLPTVERVDRVNQFLARVYKKFEIDRMKQEEYANAFDAGPWC